jgi:hypothetical protein
MPDLRIAVWALAELNKLSRDYHAGAFKKDAAQMAVLGLQV